MAKLALLLLLAATAGPAAALLSQQPNLLFIIVDDLRAQLGGAYEQSTLTPNLNALAARGVAFTRAYVQVSLCSPSRTSILTGRRPDATRLWTIGPYFRNTTGSASGIVTLPQLLRGSGWPATGAGKVWHPGTSSGGDASWGGGGVGGDDMPYSWSYAPPPGVDPRVLFWECDAWTNSTGQSAASAGVPGGAGCVTTPECLACLEAHNGTDQHAITVTPCPDVCYVDRMVADYTASRLAALAAAGQPFSFFAGFKRPHLGFQVPQHAWDAYSPQQPLAMDRWPPQGMPPAGWWRNGEITGQADTRPFVLHNDSAFPGMLANAIHAPLRRAYYASVSWMDSQVGAVLDALDAVGLSNNTWCTFLGDHGWALGEHGNWAKQQLFEHSLRVPLIIAPPRGAVGWRRGATVGAPHIVEALDLYPTIAELLGLAPPAGQLEGRSLVPFLREGPSPPPNASSFAYSQILRSDRPGCTVPGPTGFAVHPWDTDPPSPTPTAQEGEAAGQCLMGLSVRVPGYRYTAWLNYSDWSAEAEYGPIWSDIAAEELYDHTAADAPGGGGDAGLSYDDASEGVNRVGDPAYAQQRRDLLAALKAGFPQRSQSVVEPKN